MLPLIDVALSIGDKLISRMWPDPAQRDAAKLELLKMQQDGELKQIAIEHEERMAQMDINKTEAASTNPFVAGWRPSVGWICSAGLSYSFILHPMLTWLSINYGWQSPPPLDTSELVAMLGALLGFGGFRSFEKVKGAIK